MKIPWRKVWTTARDWALLIIRATGTERPAPPPEPGPGEAFDKWKDGRL